MLLGILLQFSEFQMRLQTNDLSPCKHLIYSNIRNVCKSYRFGQCHFFLLSFLFHYSCFFGVFLFVFFLVVMNCLNTHVLHVKCIIQFNNNIQLFQMLF